MNSNTGIVRSLVLSRKSCDGTRTLGVLDILDMDGKSFRRFFTMEPPWENNEKFKSCIPAGEYIMVKHDSPKFGKCFKLLDVPERTDILMHPGNFPENTTGCILVGCGFKDIDGDRKLDVVDSRKAMDELLGMLTDTCTIAITGLASDEDYYPEYYNQFDEDVRDRLIEYRKKKKKEKENG